MHCVSCGNQISPELNYCNRCGAKTGKDDSGANPINPLSYLITALCIIGGGGLLIFVALITMLLRRNMDGNAIVVIAALYLFAYLGINFTILRLISKLVNDRIDSRKEMQEKRPFELHAHDTNQLEAPRRPVASVTDHTTRALDEVMFKER